MYSLQPLVAQIATLLSSHRESIATAESCTGGRLASYLTSLSGASLWFKSGVIAYSEEQKSRLLGVDPALIDRYGVVSAEVACAMARGVQKTLQSTHALSTTGYAGPSGGSSGAPIGTVWIGIALGEKLFAYHLALRMPRPQLVESVCKEALRLFIQQYKSTN